MKKILTYTIIAILLIFLNFIVLKDIYGETTKNIYIVKVEYINVPMENKGGTIEYRQEVKITFTDGVMQVYKDRIEQTIIPLGRVEMIKNIEFNNEYYATYKFKKLK
jgi:hypothetical protein